MSFRTPWLILVITVKLCVAAESPKDASKAEAPKAPKAVDPNEFYLSAEGRKKLQDNLGQLDMSIKEAQNNLNNSEKNLKTLRNEIDELDGLERENLDLKNKLLQFLARAKSSEVKNEHEKRKLLKYEKEIETAPKIEADVKFKLKEKIAQDKTEFGRWKEDAEIKVKRVNELLGELKDSASQLNNRRIKLQDDVKAWTNTRQEYEDLLNHYKEKRAEYEKLLKEH